MKTFIYFCLSLLLLTPVYADVPYCSDTHATAGENTVLQKLVPEFATTMNCQVGNNCLRKWDAKDEHAKFSIAWRTQCGPVIAGEHQLGDNGHGSTFVCEKSNRNDTCCWPLGYDYMKKFVVCSKP